MSLNEMENFVLLIIHTLTHIFKVLLLGFHVFILFCLYHLANKNLRNSCMGSLCYCFVLWFLRPRFPPLLETLTFTACGGGVDNGSLVRPCGRQQNLACTPWCYKKTNNLNVSRTHTKGGKTHL